MKRSRKSIEADAIRFRERMQFLETAWGARVTFEVDLESGMCSFQVTPEGSSTSLVVKDARAWNVILPSA